jgi:hypothetical protein
MKCSLFLSLLAATLLITANASAHIREQGQCDPHNWCEYFYGGTNAPPPFPSENPPTIDPINVIWYPWGSLDPNIVHIFQWELSWSDSSGGSQVNNRLVGNWVSGNWWE